jgi:hypothetical protein
MPKQSNKQDKPDAVASQAETQAAGADPLAGASDIGALLTPATAGTGPDMLDTAMADRAMLDPGGIVVTSPSGPRRRAGFAFGPHETHVAAAELTEEVAEAIAADPFLAVRPYRPAVGEAAT